MMEVIPHGAYWIVKRPNIDGSRTQPSFLVWHGHLLGKGEDHGDPNFWWTVGTNGEQLATRFLTEQEARAYLMEIILSSGPGAVALANCYC